MEKGIEDSQSQTEKEQKGKWLDQSCPQSRNPGLWSLNSYEPISSSYFNFIPFNFLVRFTTNSQNMVEWGCSLKGFSFARKRLASPVLLGES